MVAWPKADDTSKEGASGIGHMIGRQIQNLSRVEVVRQDRSGTAAQELPQLRNATTIPSDVLRKNGGLVPRWSPGGGPSSPLIVPGRECSRGSDSAGTSLAPAQARPASRARDRGSLVLTRISPARRAARDGCKDARRRRTGARGRHPTTAPPAHRAGPRPIGSDRLRREGTRRTWCRRTEWLAPPRRGAGQFLGRARRRRKRRLIQR